MVRYTLTISMAEGDVDALQEFHDEAPEDQHDGFRPNCRLLLTYHESFEASQVIYECRQQNFFRKSGDTFRPQYIDNEPNSFIASYAVEGGYTVNIPLQVININPHAGTIEFHADIDDLLEGAQEDDKARIIRALSDRTIIWCNHFNIFSVPDIETNPQIHVVDNTHLNPTLQVNQVDETAPMASRSLYRSTP